MWVYFIELLYEKYNSFNKNNVLFRGNLYDDKVMGFMRIDIIFLKNYVFKICV